MSIQASQKHVISSLDGTRIAYWQSGAGTPLVMVHGTPADHTRWRPLLPYLEPHFTVCVMDRRGRGASDDSPDYTLAREHEDVAAVVDAVAAASGSPVDVYGHSHGGLCAYGAAVLTANIHKLVLYEGWPVPNPAVFALPGEVEERIDAQVANGERDDFFKSFFRHYGFLSAEDLAAFRAAPSWAGRVAAAHTITRECRAESQAVLDPGVAARITAPVLLLVGEHSPDPSQAQVEAVAEALPDARVVVLAGQEHVADALAPEVFAGHLIDFLRGE